MRRRYHKRRWTLVCFFTVMLILPAAAVIPKSGGRSSAYPYAKETGTSPADATCWNVASDGYGWEEEPPLNSHTEAGRFPSPSRFWPPG